MEEQEIPHIDEIDTENRRVLEKTEFVKSDEAVFRVRQDLFKNRFYYEKVGVPGENDAM